MGEEQMMEDHSAFENDFEQPSIELIQSTMHQPLELPEKGEFSEICGETKPQQVHAFFDLMERRQRGEVKLEQSDPAKFGSIVIERRV